MLVKHKRKLRTTSTDGYMFEAHKVILSAYSDVFKNMLVNGKHPHPVAFLGGIEHDVLEALLDFIYCGEEKVKNAEMNLFMQLSTNIELVGATSKDLSKDALAEPENQKSRIKKVR